MQNDSLIDMLSKPILVLVVITVALVFFANMIG